jgi:pyruvate/2-oxoglutarate dehydrogenase complex dihydrolipoamide dehydrogenase (E3) component
MPSKRHFDLMIVGGGQAGIPLAHAMAAKGQGVGLAERRRLGGSCVNFGCTPTKAALASAHLAAEARRAAEFGLRIPHVEVDYAAVLKRARDIAAESRHGLERGLEHSQNPLLLRGHARFIGRDGAGFALAVGDTEVTASRVVLDTGTRTLVPPIPGLETVRFLHSGNWLDHDERPEHVVMLGGGVIGLEMGQFYARLGCRVTMIVRSERVGGHEDPDVAEALRGVLAADGVTLRMSTGVERVSSVAGGVELSLLHDGVRDALRATHVFVATGRKLNTDDLGLDRVGVGVDPSGVVTTDSGLATSVPGVWAAGDIRGGPMFTHTSWDDYRILVSQLAGDRSRTTRRVVPYAIFTDPELGRVGMTETEARRSGKAFEVMRFDMSRSGRAREQGTSAGFIKVLVEQDSQRILGAAVLASGGAELVHLYVDIMNADAPATVIRDAVHIHPTMAEAIQGAVTG